MLTPLALLESIKGGPNDGVEMSLSGGPMIMGRGPDNDIDVGEDTVSRRHALMMETSDGFVLRDLNSANGTFVNRKRIADGEQRLRHGDRVRLGGSGVTFVFRQKGPKPSSWTPNLRLPRSPTAKETGP